MNGVEGIAKVASLAFSGWEDDNYSCQVVTYSAVIWRYLSFKEGYFPQGDYLVYIHFLLTCCFKLYLL